MALPILIFIAVFILGFFWGKFYAMDKYHDSIQSSILKQERLQKEVLSMQAYLDKQRDKKL